MARIYRRFGCVVEFHLRSWPLGGPLDLDLLRDWLTPCGAANGVSQTEVHHCDSKGPAVENLYILARHADGRFAKLLILLTYS